MKTQELQQIQDCHDWAKEIRESLSTVEALEEKAAVIKAQIVAEKLLIGQTLAKAKATFPHGRWLGWLRERLPKLHPRTAQNYILAANAKGVSRNCGLLKRYAAAREARP